jgi:hypothetical protein
VRFFRNETPPPQARYQNYKPFLRRDFLYRCAYCEIHEAHIGGHWGFGVDHFCPKGKFRKLCLVYRNLYYACNLCNTMKGETWPSRREQKHGYRFVDVCQEDLYVTHLESMGDGVLESRTRAGEYTLKHLRLNRRQLRQHRTRLIEARTNLESLRAVLTRVEVPPDLALRASEQLAAIEKEYFNPDVPY